MRRNFTFKRRRSHKLLFSLVATLSVVVILGLAYASYAKTDKTMSCDIVYSIPDEELKLEFENVEEAPKEYGVIRRCENPEIICYYIGGTRNIFCQFKRFDKTRSKGNLRPN